MSYIKERKYMKVVLIIAVIAIMLGLVFVLSSCKKLVNTEYKEVKVNVVDEYYRGSYITPIYTGKVITFITHSAVYKITVEYNGTQYTLNGSSTYKKYKDKVGQTAIGTLEIHTYDDGTVRYNITKLE